MSKGILFHSTGAHVENALSPYVLLLDFCCKRSCREFERSVLEWFWYWSNSTKYRGPRPFRALKTSKSNLNTTRKEIGSQWSFTRIGLLWSNLRAPHTKRAAMFCSSWSFLSWYWVIHKKESYSCNERAVLNFTIRFLCWKPRYSFSSLSIVRKGCRSLVLFEE